MSTIQFVHECGGNPRDVIIKHYTELMEKHVADNNLNYRTYTSLIIDTIDFERILDTLENFGQLLYVNSRGYSCILPDCFMLINIINRSEYINIYFEIFGPNRERLKKVVNQINETFAHIKKDAITADICWHYLSQHGLESETVREILDDKILTGAYPYIEDLDKFIHEYITSKEQVLLLMGDPGTGKTRLVRHILRHLSEYKRQSNGDDIINLTGIVERENSLRGGHTNADLSVIYTTDSKTLKNDELVISFLTDTYDAMVLEDMDFNLGNRTDGNVSMYRLLASSDGLLSNRNKKIIISTNIDTESKIDDALIRPGRCFSIIKTRKLQPAEGNKILKQLGSDAVVAKPHTLAELYKISIAGRLDVTVVRKIGF